MERFFSKHSKILDCKEPQINCPGRYVFILSWHCLWQSSICNHTILIQKNDISVVAKTCSLIYIFLLDSLRRSLESSASFIMFPPSTASPTFLLLLLTCDKIEVHKFKWMPRELNVSTVHHVLILSCYLLSNNHQTSLNIP